MEDDASAVGAALRSDPELCCAAPAYPIKSTQLYLLHRWLLAVFIDQRKSYSACMDIQDVLIGIAVIHVQIPVANAYSPLRLYLIVGNTGNLVVDISSPAP